MNLVLIIAASFAAGCLVTWLVLRAIAKIYDDVNHIISGTADEWYL